MVGKNLKGALGWELDPDVFQDVQRSRFDLFKLLGAKHL
jgi:hypothetical protein